MGTKRGKETSLSEKLSSLIHAKPSVVDSDDDNDFTTVEKLSANKYDAECSADELETQTFRKSSEKLLEEDDSKYLGKGISRKELTSSVDSESSITEDDISDNESDEDRHQSEIEMSENESEIVPDCRSELFRKARSRNDSKSNRGKSEENIFNKEIFSKVVSDIEKGKAIKNQLHIWDFFLDCRMKFQKCLVASNQFPAYSNFKKFKSKGGSEFQESVNQTSSSLKRLLCSLLSLQEYLLKVNEDLLHSSINEKFGCKTEEETDDSELDENSQSNEICHKEKCIDKKIAKGSSTDSKELNYFSREIFKKHKRFENCRNSIIQKWNEKTKMAHINNKNFSAFEQSTLKQIEHVLLDKPRLIKRTQTKRSNYHILGESDELPIKRPKKEDEYEHTNSLSTKTKVIIQKEIFDDDDFYHHLLSELVKRKASDVTDPVQLGRQWMQLQKFRSKMKKNVDVKASKGRKVRFVVHPKLVNFMMPMNDFVYSEDSRVELFNSLFGKNKNGFPK